MYKKGADYKAGITIGVIIIYFIFLSFIINVVADFDNSINNSNSGFLGGVINSVGTQDYGYCANPRYRYSYDSIEPYEISSVNDNYLSCEYTEGIKSQAICQNLTGCEWTTKENNTFWNNFFCGLSAGIYCTSGDSFETCTGNLNVSSWDIDTWTTSGLLGTTSPNRRISEYTFMDYWGMSDEYDNLITYLGYANSTTFGFNRVPASDDTICQHPNVILSKNSCEYFQCTWKEEKFTQDFTNVKSNMITMLFKVFTFQYDFGFENSNINLFLYLILIFIPMFILFLSILYALFG